MDPVTRNLIFSIPQQADLGCKDQSGHQVGLSEEPRYEYLDFGHHDQKDESKWRTSNMPEETSLMSAKLTDGRQDLWNPNPDRESKLEVVGSGSLYDIRAYKEEKKKPLKLYSADDDEEEEEELRYKLPPKELSPDITKSLHNERQEVIRSQAVRKHDTVAARWSSMEELEALNTGSPARDSPAVGRSYSTGFAVCFDNPSPGWVRTAIAPGSIDTEQINFAAARQQFRALEKSNPNLLRGPKRQVATPTSQTTAGSSVKGRQNPEVLEDFGSPFGGKQRESDPAGPPQRSWSPTSYGPVTTYQNCSGEDMASTLKSTPDNKPIQAADGQVPWMESGEPLAGGHASTQELDVRDETPIEREIRLAIEREENLWKERGVCRASNRDELVQIPSKPLLSSSVSSLASSHKGKDKPRVSFYVQREIEQETKREADLQKEGRLLGTYDKGFWQDLGERRKVFEQEQTPAPPSQQLETPEGEQENPVSEFAPERAYVDDRERAAHPNLNQAFEVWRPYFVANSGKRGPGDDLSLSSQSGITFEKQMDRLQPRVSSPLKMADSAEEGLLRKEHFAIRKPNFSVSDGQGPPPSVQRKERRVEWMAPRDELYTLRTWMPRTSELIEQEIQDALQREMELQEQRRKVRPTLTDDADGPTEQGPYSRMSSQSSGKGWVGAGTVSLAYGQWRAGGRAELRASWRVLKGPPCMSFCCGHCLPLSHSCTDGRTDGQTKAHADICQK